VTLVGGRGFQAAELRRGAADFERRGLQGGDGKYGDKSGTCEANHAILLRRTRVGNRAGSWQSRPAYSARPRTAKLLDAGDRGLVSGWRAIGRHASDALHSQLLHYRAHRSRQEYT